jgi:hypothetical protein
MLAERRPTPYSLLLTAYSLSHSGAQLRICSDSSAILGGSSGAEPSANSRPPGCTTGAETVNLGRDPGCPWGARAAASHWALSGAGQLWSAGRHPEPTVPVSREEGWRPPPKTALTLTLTLASRAIPGGRLPQDGACDIRPPPFRSSKLSTKSSALSSGFGLRLSNCSR